MQRVDYNSIGKKGAKEIANLLKINSTLTLINLGNLLHHTIDGNSLGNEGAKEIAKALRDNYTLTTLSLCKALRVSIGGNRITAEAAKEFETAIRENQTLSVLNLGIIRFILEENNLGEEGAKGIMEASKDKHTIKRIMIGKM